MNNKNLKKILGAIFGIMAGIIFIHLGASQHYLEAYVNILILIVGVLSIILNTSLLKEYLSK